MEVSWVEGWKGGDVLTYFPLTTGWFVGHMKGVVTVVVDKAAGVALDVMVRFTVLVSVNGGGTEVVAMVEVEVKDTEMAGGTEVVVTIRVAVVVKDTETAGGIEVVVTRRVDVKVKDTDTAGSTEVVVTTLVAVDVMVDVEVKDNEAVSLRVSVLINVDTTVTEEVKHGALDTVLLFAGGIGDPSHVPYAIRHRSGLQ